MKQTSLILLCALVVFLLAFFSTAPVAAHGDEPRVEISADRLSPGSVLDLRGVAFEAEEEITLTLVGPQNEISFGSVLADTEGIFMLSITLPVDLPEGTYVIHAVTDDHAIDSPPITVFGSADLGQGDDGQREEEDPLFAPMPTVAAGAATAIPQPAAAVENEAPKASAKPLIWIAAGIALIVMLGLLVRRGRP